MARKKVTRKQLLKEPDEFLTLSAKTIQWAQANSRQLSWTLAAILLLAIVFSAIRFFSVQAEAKSLVLLDQHKAAYEALLKKDGTPQKAYGQVKPSLEALIKKYNGKNGAKMATVFYADISYRAGQYDQAIGLYRRALDDYREEPAIHDLIVSSLAYAYQGKKDYPSALKYFQQLVDGPRTTLKPEALFNLAAVYAQSGDAAGEKEALQKIIAEYDNSIYAPVAREKLAVL
jgi:tetratricopeptide (TPR) repeat protein